MRTKRASLFTLKCPKYAFKKNKLKKDILKQQLLCGI